MRIAVYGTEIQPDFIPIYQRIFNFFEENQIEYALHSRIKELLNNSFDIKTNEETTFDVGTTEKNDFILSVGGDGTFLNAVNYSLINDTPIIGINCGRLGFLADVASEELEGALTQLVNNQFEIEQRALLELVEPKSLFDDGNYAMNELTVQKTDNSSMIKVKTFVNGEFLSNYWADGLIVATPTGSTAYSLSVGGPIITPDLAGWVITPIAPHNLTVRPMVVPDIDEIELRVEGRGNQFLASFDHRSTVVDFSTSLKIRKAKVTVPLVKIKGQSFFLTLRNKLMWGADRRN